jgi:hypothetical protein
MIVLSGVSAATKQGVTASPSAEASGRKSRSGVDLGSVIDFLSL